MARPLAGVSVLDMGTFITGPAAGMLLADLGAEVIKVEMPGTGDPFRAFKGDLYSPHYQTYNRNKKSIELNTKEPEDLAAFDELVTTADVFIQNFRPGVAERLGVGPERLQGDQPAAGLLRHLGLRQRRAVEGPAGVRHRQPGGDRVPAAAGQPGQSARRRPGDRRCGDRLLRRVRRGRGALRARDDRQGAAGRDLDVRGDEPLQPRRLHPLPVGGRGDGPVVAAARLADLRVPVRGRRLDRAAHVEPAQVLGEPRRGGRAAGHAAAARVREPPGADRQLREGGRIPRADLRASSRARTGRSGWPRSRCRIRRSIPRRKWSRASWPRTTSW